MDVAEEMLPNAKPGDSIQVRCTVDSSDENGLVCTVDEAEPMEMEEPEESELEPEEASKRPAALAAVLGKKKKAAKAEPIEEEEEEEEE